MQLRYRKTMLYGVRIDVSNDGDKKILQTSLRRKTDPDAEIMNVKYSHLIQFV